MNTFIINIYGENVCLILNVDAFKYERKNELKLLQGLLDIDKP